MQLSHRFTVSGPVEETWVQFQDIADVAQCFPGAQVTATEGDTFEGTVKVKLGPIALVYAGAGSFTEKDESAHRFVVEAKGRDKRGNGTASATVTLTMTPNGEATDVQVDTDLAITGKPAQFGRGVMQDVSDKLLGQFVTCLEQRSDVSSASDSPAGGGPGTAAIGGDTGGDTGQDTSGDTGGGNIGGDAAAVAAGGSSATAADADTGQASAPSAAAATSAGSAPGSAVGSAPGSAPEAIDLGTTVLPAIARAYWRQALAGVLGVVLVVAVLRRLLR